MKKATTHTLMFIFMFYHPQIDEGVTLNVAGGLMLEHPLTLPFVKEVVISLPLPHPHLPL